MSVTFTKLFSSITESTVWCEPDRTRLVWICMLAMADRHGRVYGSIPGLANRARVPVEDARKAIETFLKPDGDSRTKEHAGRRIEEMDGGWRLLNHAKYREIRDEESTLEAKRRYINARRARERAEKEASSSSTSSTVDRSRDNAEAYTEADKEKNTRAKKPAASAFALPDWIPAEAWDGYVEMRKKRSKPMTDRARTLQVAKLQAFRDAGHNVGVVLDQSTANDWTDLYEPKAANVVPMNSGRVRV